MSKQIKTLNFGLGISDELRDSQAGSFSYAENFDIGRQNNTIKQVVNNAANNVCAYDPDYNFLKIIKGTYMYALGQSDSVNKYTTLYYKDDNLDSGDWAVLTNGTTSSAIRLQSDPFFAVYKGYIYFDEGAGNYISRYAIGTETMTTNWQSLSGGMRGGVIGKDDNLYGWTQADGTTASKLYQINGTTLSLVSLSLPASQSIIDAVPYGNYLALITVPVGSSSDTSRMYLWDYTSPDVTEAVDIGYGSVAGADILDGMLYAVIALPNSRGFRIKAYSGGIFQTTVTYYGRLNRAATTNIAVPATLVKSYSGFLYFMVLATRPDTTESNTTMHIFRYGKIDLTKQNTLSVFKTIDVDDNPSLGTVYNDFYITESQSNMRVPVGIYATIYTGSNTSVFVCTTNSSNSTVWDSEPGVLETQVYTGEDVSTAKNIIAFSPYYRALSSGQSVEVKYKKDGETEWTSIFTDTTVGSSGHDCTNIESTGDALPDFNEIQFRIEVLGGVELTGYKFKYVDLNDAYGK